MKRFKITVVFIMMCMLCLVPYRDAYAFKRGKTFSQIDVSTWNQGSKGFPDKDGVSFNDKITLGYSKDTIHESGCGYYALSYMLLKTGAINPKTTTPIDIVRKANNGDNTDSGGWHFNFSKVGLFNSDLTCTDKYLNVEGMSVSEQKTFVKGKYNDGYFVIICLRSNDTSGHYVFLDGYQGDDMVIGDSGFDGIKWSDYYGSNGGSMKYLMLFKSKSGKKPADLPSIYSDVMLNNSGSSTNPQVGGEGEQNGQMSDGEKAVYERLVDEWELKGMPEKYYLKDIQCEIPMEGSLSSIDENTVSYIKENIENDNEDKVIAFISKVISLIGLILMLYGVLMISSYTFDKANIVFDFSLLRVISFGKYTIATDEFKNTVVNGVLFISFGKLLRRVLFIEIVGIMLLQKVILFGWFRDFLNVILDFLNRF